MNDAPGDALAPVATGNAGLKVRASLSAPVSFAIFGTRYDRIKLQIYRNTEY
ncbi:MAG: hypothetical protein WCS31_04330 [Verrucomicrobiae bacterium]